MEFKRLRSFGDRDESLQISDREIDHIFADENTAKRFPPFLTLQQAAELLQCPVGTVRDWRSRGLLRGCSRKIGREVRFLRDRLIKQVFNYGLRPETK